MMQQSLDPEFNEKLRKLALAQRQPMPVPNEIAPIEGPDDSVPASISALPVGRLPMRQPAQIPQVGDPGDPRAQTPQFERNPSISGMDLSQMVPQFKRVPSTNTIPPPPQPRFEANPNPYIPQQEKLGNMITSQDAAQRQAENEPISGLRKFLGVAAGVGTGLAFRNPSAGFGVYDLIANSPRNAAAAKIAGAKQGAVEELGRVKDLSTQQTEQERQRISAEAGVNVPREQIAQNQREQAQKAGEFETQTELTERGMAQSGAQHADTLAMNKAQLAQNQSQFEAEGDRIAGVVPNINGQVTGYTHEGTPKPLGAAPGNYDVLEDKGSGQFFYIDKNKPGNAMPIISKETGKQIGTVNKGQNITGVEAWLERAPAQHAYLVKQGNKLPPLDAWVADQLQNVWSNSAAAGVGANAKAGEKAEAKAAASGADQLAAAAKSEMMEFLPKDHTPTRQDFYTAIEKALDKIIKFRGPAKEFRAAASKLLHDEADAYSAKPAEADPFAKFRETPAAPPR